MPTSGPGRSEVTPPAMPIAAEQDAGRARRRRRARLRSRLRCRRRVRRPPQHAAAQRDDAGAAVHRTGGCAFRAAAVGADACAAARTGARAVAALRRDAVRDGCGPPAWAQPAPTSAATIGNHRAIDALSHVGVKSAVKMPSQRGWRHLLYILTRINLGLSPDELYEMDLHTRIRRNARDSYQIGVFGLKGGVGKTAVTVSLGSALSKVRGDRILAVDADPDGGNLADRAGRQSAATIGDLLVGQGTGAVQRHSRLHEHERREPRGAVVGGLQRCASRVQRRGLEGRDGIVSRYYNLVLADCGAGLFQPASRGVLSTVSGMVIVASASIDGARQAAVTMDWLRQNGYQDLLGRSCVVINHVMPGKPNIDVEDLVQQFERHVPPGRVIVLP